MNNLTTNELADIYAGGIKIGLVTVLVAVGTFIVGVIDGYFRPLKCNK